MNTKWELSKSSKIELTKLAMANALAHGAVLRMKNPKSIVTAEEREKLVQTENETMESLKKAVAQLTLKQVIEAAEWIKYKATHDPVEPVGQGKSDWNGKTARTLVGALWSLVSALRTVHGKSDSRVGQASNRAKSTDSFVKACTKTGFCPKDGMSYETKKIVLEKLDALMLKVKAEGRIDEAKKLNELYAKASNDLSFLKPAKKVELPKGITVNASPDQGIANLGQVLQPVGESASAEPVPEPKAEAEQPVAARKPEQAPPAPEKSRKSGPPPFKSARPGGKAK